MERRAATTIDSPKTVPPSPISPPLHVELNLMTDPAEPSPTNFSSLRRYTRLLGRRTHGTGIQRRAEHLVAG
jgi:hypothetical protein